LTHKVPWGIVELEEEEEDGEWSETRLHEGVERERNRGKIGDRERL